MQKSKENLSISAIISLAGSFIVLAVLLLCAFIEKDSGTVLSKDINLFTVPGWTVNGEKPTSFPYRQAVSPGETVVIKNKLPSDLDDDIYMTFRALYCSVVVDVEGETIYEYGVDPLVPLGHITGNVRILVPLSSEMAGKEVTIRMNAFYTFNNDFYDIEFGYAGDIKTRIFYDNLLRLFLAALMSAIFIGSVGIAVANALERSLLNTRLLLNFAAFVLLINSWIVCSSDIPQILGKMNSTSALISYVSLAMLPIPYSGFCEQLLTKGKTFFTYSKMICWALPIVEMIAFILGLFDPPQTLSLVHLSIFVISGASLVFAIMDRKSGKTAKILLGSFIELIVAIVIGFACFYFAPSKGYDATVFGIGLVIFLFMLFGLIVARQVSSIEERKYLEIYKELAYSDILTGLGNRAGFDRDFSRLLEYKDRGTLFTLFMLDINYLKETNDRFGHQAGDQILMSFAECLRKVFDRHGTCYRLGGDEFAVICTGLSVDAEELEKRLDDEVEGYNKTHERKLSSARGFSSMIWMGENDFFNTIFKIADQRMYEDKQIKHQMKWEDIYRDNG